MELHRYLSERFATTRPTVKLPTVPIDEKLAELKQFESSNSIELIIPLEQLEDKNFEELNKKIEKYLSELISIDGIFNIYKVRQFFEFNQAKLYSSYPMDSPGRDLSGIMNLNQNELAANSSSKVSGRLSVLPNYFRDATK